MRGNSSKINRLFMKVCEGSARLTPFDKLYTPVFLVTLMAVPPLLAVETDPWFDDDWESRTEAVSDGELRFLAVPPDESALHTSNYLSLTLDSLDTGWVSLYQCQRNLDPISAVEISYQYQQIRRLRIASSKLIGKAWVEGQTVQLVDGSKGAEVCIRAEVRILKKTSTGDFQIRSGPFYRRFLDGYYPVHLDYRLFYPEDLLNFKFAEPFVQEGLPVSVQPGKVIIDTWFEGELNITLVLSEAS